MNLFVWKVEKDLKNLHAAAILRTQLKNAYNGSDNSTKKGPSSLSISSGKNVSLLLHVCFIAMYSTNDEQNAQLQH